MTFLTPGDFRRIDLDDNIYYFEHKFADGESVCLEVCLNGFDVARYDKNDDLIGEKQCTNLATNHPLAAIIKGIEIANQMMIDKVGGITE